MIRSASITRPCTARLTNPRSAQSIPVSPPSDSRPARLGDLVGGVLLAVVAIVVLAPTMVHSEPIVTACQVRMYATVPNPQSLALAPDGTIYSGHDSHQGDTHAGPVFRIAPGGAPVAGFGNQLSFDPDGVLYDPDGSATGITGGLLVCDWNPGSGSSAVQLIHPDESVTTWAAPGQAIMNPTYMVMDATGAVWLTDDYRYQTGLVRVIAGIAQVVVSGPSDGFCGIAISPAGTLCVSGNTDGTNKTIREYDLNDDLLQGEFATSASYDVLAFGHGGSFGSDLYAMSLHGDLYRLGSNGNAIPVGSGFQAPVDSKFGSDGNLYVSEDTEGRVLQITSDASAVSPWATTRSPGSSSVSVFPNPSRGVTKIGLALGTTQPEICVGAFDVEGRQIRSLHSGPLTAGAHTISWNGVDTCGRHCANGTYYVQIHALGTQLQTKFVRTD